MGWDLQERILGSSSATGLPNKEMNRVELKCQSPPADGPKLDDLDAKIKITLPPLDLFMLSSIHRYSPLYHSFLIEAEIREGR